MFSELELKRTEYKSILMPDTILSHFAPVPRQPVARLHGPTRRTRMVGVCTPRLTDATAAARHCTVEGRVVSLRE